MKPLISAKELEGLFTQQDFILMDARQNKEDYLRNHLLGAYHLDLETELSDISSDAAKGGRHPLPSPIQFAKILTKMGVNKDSHIVIYDEKNAAMAAARLWWMLRAAGLEKVQVLDGGIQGVKTLNIPTEDGFEAKNKSGDFHFDSWKLPRVGLASVEEASKSQSKCIVDVRDNKRYLGEEEPIDLVAGHIPNAINIPFKENLNTDGTFKSADVLKQKYANVFNEFSAEDIIVHCGSGVTACHTLLAMHLAGYKVPNLYVGSWSEWYRNNKPIATTNNIKME